MIWQREVIIPIGLLHKIVNLINNMKKSNTLSWIFTGLLLTFMTFSTIPNISSTPKLVKFVVQLGYPYFVPFIGVAKALGVIAVLIPGFAHISIGMDRSGSFHFH
jgi:hypothetical protein